MDFDWVLYTSYYPDLHIFKNEHDALNHYQYNGKREGRIKDINGLISNISIAMFIQIGDWDVFLDDLLDVYEFI